MNEELFSIPEVKSPRLKWMERHGIQVLHFPDIDTPEPYVATRYGKEIAKGGNAEWACYFAAKKLNLKTWNEEP